MNNLSITLRMAEIDKAPTRKYLFALHNEILSLKFSKYELTVADTNYATDPKDKHGTRRPHYLAKAIHGNTNRYGLLFTTKAIFPYDWFNPDLNDIEPGFISVILKATPIATDLESTNPATDVLATLYAYNHMCDNEYPGSRNTIIARNAEADYSITTTAINRRRITK